MNEDLIGYLTGALEPHERELVSRRLAQDPALRDELDRVRELLAPLDEAGPVPTPPPGLLARALEQLELANLPAAESDDKNGPATDEVDADASANQDQPSSLSSSSLSSSSLPSSLPALSDRASHSGRFGTRPLDFAMIAVATAIVMAFLLPAINRFRESSRRLACQDQLQSLGTSLVQFVSKDPGKRLPAIASSGPKAFSGMYAVELNSADLLHAPEIRWCPGRDSFGASDYRLIDPMERVSSDDLENASVNMLRELQRAAGGDYAYNLGVVEKERYQSPRFEARASFAVLSDRVNVSPVGWTSDGMDSKSYDAHLDGINVLYEDGSVQFVNLDSVSSLPDNPFENHRGLPEAGVTIDDASLAPSWRPPFRDANQR